MSAKEILSEQMTQMRVELSEINIEQGKIKEALDILNRILKNPLENPDPAGNVVFTASQFKSICELWEHMYKAVR